MLKEIINTSIFISALQKIYSQGRFITDKLYKVFLDSQTYKLMAKFQEGARVNFRYSFLGKITEIGQGQNLAILETSRVVKRLRELFDKYTDKILNYLKTSIITNSIRTLNKNLYLFPIKTASMIIIIVMMTNILLALLLKNEIRLSGWLMYAILLFIACNGLYSKISLEELAKTSYLIRRLNNSCKI